MATFGKTSGNVATLFPATSSVLSASRFTLSDNNALISKMTVYSSVLTAASSIKALIYEVGGDNLPSSLIAVTQEASVGAGVNILIDAPFASPPTLNSGDYFLAIMANGTFTGSASNIGAGTLLNPLSGLSNNYPTVTSPYPSVITLSANQKTIYATYTVQDTSTVWATAIT